MRSNSSTQIGPSQNPLARRRGFRKVALGVLIFSILLLSLLPTVISHSPIADQLVGRVAEAYGWKAKAIGIHCGWFTPIQLEQLDLVGPSGKTQIHAGKLHTEITGLDLVLRRADMGTISLSGTSIEVWIDDGISSLESDLQSLTHGEEVPSQQVADSGQAGLETKLKLKLADASALVIDSASDMRWAINGIHGDLAFSGGWPTGNVSATLVDPWENAGKLETRIQSSDSGGSAVMELQVSGLSASFIQPLSRRMQWFSNKRTPPQFAGLLNGAVHVAMDSSGQIRGDFRDVEVDGLIAQGVSEKPWNVSRVRCSGALAVTESGLEGTGFRVDSDMGSIDLNGVIRWDVLQQDSDKSWIEVVQGTANANIDIAQAIHAMPGLVPLRQHASIESAVLRVGVRGTRANDGFSSTMTIDSDPIRASSRGRAILIEPMNVELIARPRGRWIAADRLRVRSMFAGATAQGDLQRGKAEFHVDLGRLASMISPLVDVSDANLGGSAAGNISWSAQPNHVWTMNGNARAAKLSLALPGGTKITEPSLEIDMDAVGVWKQDRLDALSQAQLEIKNPGQHWVLRLEQPVTALGPKSEFPIAAQGSGRLESLANWIAPILPNDTEQLRGQFHVTTNGKFHPSGGVVNHCVLKLEQPEVLWRGSRYKQQTLNVNLDGRVPTGAGPISLNSLTVQGNAAALNMQGDYHAEGESDLDLAWRIDLSRLQDLRHSAFTDSAPLAKSKSSGGTHLSRGQLEGRASIVGTQGQWKAVVDAAGKNVEIVSAASSPTGTAEQLWFEPSTHVKGALHYDQNRNLLLAKDVAVTLDWLNALLEIHHDDQGWSVGGPTRIQNDVIAGKLRKWIDPSIQMTGVTDSPIQVSGDYQSEASHPEAQFGVSWDTAQIAGIEIGPAELKFRASDGIVHVQPTALLLKQGTMNLGGQVDYSGDAVAILPQTGPVLRGVQLDTKLTRGWLKYVAPLVADATAINGTFNLDIEQARIVPSDMKQSRIVGRLGIDSAEVGPGPVAQSLVQTVSQATSLIGKTRNLSAGNTWVELPSQTVDFELARSMVTHQRLMMKVDNVVVFSSGAVSLDGRLDLNTQIPVEASWAGKDLEKAGLVGQVFQVPVDGSFSRPSIDSRGLQRSLASVGTKALEETARNALQKEISRGLQKIFGNR